jgi:hypothetical protein
MLDSDQKNELKSFSSADARFGVILARYQPDMEERLPFFT